MRAIRHYVGAFLLELGGVDVITFSGGIGENSAEIRAAVLKGLAAFRRRARRREERGDQGRGRDFDRLRSAVKVLVIPANEESIVARETVAVVRIAGTGAQQHRLLAGQVYT